MVMQDFPLHERHRGGAASAEETKIGEIIANSLIDNGATLQMGMLIQAHHEL